MLHDSGGRQCFPWPCVLMVAPQHLCFSLFTGPLSPPSVFAWPRRPRTAAALGTLFLVREAGQDQSLLPVKLQSSVIDSPFMTRRQCDRSQVWASIWGTSIAYDSSEGGGSRVWEGKGAMRCPAAVRERVQGGLCMTDRDVRQRGGGRDGRGEGGGIC